MYLSLPDIFVQLYNFPVYLFSENNYHYNKHIAQDKKKEAYPELLTVLRG
jgi:hypothetical protein